MKISTLSKLIGISLISIVASANAQFNLDLSTTTTTGTHTTDLDTVKFTWDQLQPTGTGVLDSFLRVQRNGTEQGYNTTQANAGALPFEEKFGNFTHDVTFASMVDHDNDGFYEFVLDIGEPVVRNKSESLLTLDGLKLFATDTAGQNGNAVDGNGNWVGPAGNSTLLWDLDSDIGGNYQDNFILLDANRNGKPGNGVSDMLMDVTKSIIDNAIASQPNFILWSRFGLGSASGEDSHGTFEEWAQVRDDSFIPPPPSGGGEVPEPRTTALIAVAFLALLIARRKIF
jgi:hypothetical protein